MQASVGGSLGTWVAERAKKGVSGVFRVVFLKGRVVVDGESSTVLYTGLSRSTAGR